MTATINASTSGGGGIIQTADSSGILALQTAGVTAVTINGSQNVGIGTSSPSSLLDVNGKITAAKGSSSGITVGDVSTNSNSVLRMQGTSAGYNWQIANNLNIAGIEFTPSTATGGTTYTTPAVSVTSNGIGLGNTTPASGIGIKFPASQSASSDANTLDDYEEGTWTPTPNNVTATNCSYSGWYVKIGRLVYVGVKITIGAGGSFASTANSSYFSGLPFTLSTAENSPCIMSSSAIQNIGIGVIYYSSIMYLPTSSVSVGNGPAWVSGTYTTST